MLQSIFLDTTDPLCLSTWYIDLAKAKSEASFSILMIKAIK